MTDKEIFDSDYVETSPTESSTQENPTRTFLESGIQPKDIKRYGISKPQRIVIKAKISDG